MPFKSDKQRKWMHANEPEMAKKWEKEEKNEGNIGITTKKGKSIELTHKKSGKEIVVQNTPSVLKKYAKMGYLISMPEGKLNEAKFKDIDVKKLGKKKTNDLMKYLFNIVDLGLKTDMKTDTKKKILSVNISKISPKVAQNIQKRFGVDLTEGKLEEKAKRDYKTEYKKYGSSKKSKKYRAELNKYNRQKGTYGNGDKKDASHKGGKIVGFEEQSKNRGRREKSRLKKEQKLTKSRLIQIIKEAKFKEIPIDLDDFYTVRKLLKPKRQHIIKHPFSKKTFGLKVDKKQYDKTLEMLMKKRIDVQG